MKAKERTTTAVATADERAVEFVPMGASDKIRLTAAMVRAFIAVPTKSGALPTERDCIKFIMLCRGKRANPFEGDCFLIGYDSQNGPSFSLVCGLELFQKRAEQSENYDGCESGVVVQTADGLTERQGSLVLDGEKLVGGWAKAYRKDRVRPESKTVSFAVYDTGRNRWLKDPGGQIEKVAKSQALRGAYPSALGALYTQEEMERITEAGGGNITLREPVGMPRLLDAPPDLRPAQQDEPERAGSATNGEPPASDPSGPTDDEGRPLATKGEAR